MDAASPKQYVWMSALHICMCRYGVSQLAARHATSVTASLRILHHDCSPSTLAAHVNNKQHKMGYALLANKLTIIAS